MATFPVAASAARSCAPEQDQGFKALMQASADQQGCEPVVLDYPTTLKGRTLRSATAIFRDSSGHRLPACA